MQRYKHRVIVEVTFDQKVTSKFAKCVVEEAIVRGQIDTLGVVRFETKEAERVINGEINWRTRRASSSGEPGES